MPRAANDSPLIVILLAMLLLTGCTGAAAATPWPEGSVHGPWRTVYTGYGSVSADDEVITLSPQPARDPGVTHAALVTASPPAPTTTIAMRTTQQLRTPQPNPWEVGWLLWNYADNVHFYYLALKPNGWEIGKADPAYPGSQRFLASGTQSFPIGEWYSVNLHADGQAVRVSVDGELLHTVTDTERAYPPGDIGLYTEDATVEFRPELLKPP